MARIAIVGGGLAGLTVAYRRMRAGDLVTLFEAEDRLGGQLWTAREDGFVVELGAEGFVARSEAVPRLVSDLSEESVGRAVDDSGFPLDTLLDQRQTTSFRWTGEELRALLPGEAAEALSFQVARSDKGAGIRTFVGGMEALTERLRAVVAERIEIRLSTRVTSLAEDATSVRLGSTAQSSVRETFDAVVVATSSQTASSLLGDALADPALALLETLSSVTVSLAYEARQVGHALDGTGFVVGEPFEGFRACTFTSSKFAHRAPPGWLSLRVFFRPTPEELAVDTAWGARAASVLGRVLPIDGPPRRVWVSRWADALPVFTPAYREAVARTEARLSDRIHLAGSTFHGSGIDAAVRSAEAVAARLGATKPAV